MRAGELDFAWVICGTIHVSQAQHTDRHLHYSVLQSLPPAQAHLDDQPIFVPPMGMSFGLTFNCSQALSAVTQPNKSRAVFAYALKECPPVRSPEYVLLISCLSCLIILQRNDPHFGERSAHAHPILRRRASSRTRRCGTRLENLCITFILSSRHQWLVVSVSGRLPFEHLIPRCRVCLWYPLKI